MPKRVRYPTREGGHVIFEAKTKEEDDDDEDDDEDDNEDDDEDDDEEGHSTD